jgi:hypothetical protein
VVICRPSPARRARRPEQLLAALALAATATITGCGMPTAANPDLVGIVVTADGDAAATLASLPVKGRAPATGYSRDKFGQRWADTDRDGCDQRNQVLARDLVDEQLRPGSRCVVLSGRLADPYTGEVIEFRRGPETSDDVQIDHVVSLSNAWQTGAQQLTPAERERLANDLVNLQATSGPVNQAKGDADAATWLPPATEYRCRYVARQVTVKARYGLWVTRPERDAIARVLARCPGEPLSIV